MPNSVEKLEYAIWLNLIWIAIPRVIAEAVKVDAGQRVRITAVRGCDRACERRCLACSPR